MPKVSILIPCYNAQLWVGEAIQSALDQTHQDTEVIVVDDGSNDRSLEVIRSFGNRIQWETGPNRGGNVARNRLLELAIGEWVQYLDADDYLLPQKIENQLRTPTSTHVDAVYGPTILAWMSGQTEQQRCVSALDQEAGPLQHWLNWQLGQTAALLWRKQSLAQIGGWKESQPCCQDNEITLRGLQHGLRFEYCDFPGVVYRLFTNGTVSQRNPLQTLDEKAILIQSFRDWLDAQSRLTSELEKMVNDVIFRMARAAAAIDLNAGAQRAQRWQQCGLYSQCTIDSPLTYTTLHKLFGFNTAERVAYLSRSLKSVASGNARR